MGRTISTAADVACRRFESGRPSGRTDWHSLICGVSAAARPQLPATARHGVRHSVRHGFKRAFRTRTGALSQVSTHVKGRPSSHRLSRLPRGRLADHGTNLPARWSRSRGAHAGACRVRRPRVRSSRASAAPHSLVLRSAGEAPRRRCDARPGRRKARCIRGREDLMLAGGASGSLPDFHAKGHCPSARTPWDSYND